MHVFVPSESAFLRGVAEEAFGQDAVNFRPASEGGFVANGIGAQRTREFLKQHRRDPYRRGPVGLDEVVIVSDEDFPGVIGHRRMVYLKRLKRRWNPWKCPTVILCELAIGLTPTEKNRAHRAGADAVLPNTTAEGMRLEVKRQYTKRHKAWEAEKPWYVTWWPLAWVLAAAITAVLAFGVGVGTDLFLSWLKQTREATVSLANTTSQPSGSGVPGGDLNLLFKIESTGAPLGKVRVHIDGPNCLSWPTPPLKELIILGRNKSCEFKAKIVGSSRDAGQPALRLTPGITLLDDASKRTIAGKTLTIPDGVSK